MTERCTGLTKDGAPCRRKPTYGRTRCAWHTPEMVFVHVPRTATTSMIIQMTGRTYAPHTIAAQWRDDLADHWAEAIKVGFVRDPRDLVLSWFLYHKQNYPHLPMYQRTFGSWVESGCPHHWAQHATPNGRFWYEPFPKDSHPCSLSVFLTDPDTGESLMDFTGRYENLQEDYQAALEILCFVPITDELGKHRASVYDGPYYTQDLWDRVTEQFAEDIERFGYAD